MVARSSTFHGVSGQRRLYAPGTTFTPALNVASITKLMLRYRLCHFKPGSKSEFSFRHPPAPYERDVSCQFQFYAVRHSFLTNKRCQVYSC